MLATKKNKKKEEIFPEIESPREEIRHAEKYLRMKALHKKGGKLVFLGVVMFLGGWIMSSELPGGFWSDLSNRFVPPDLVGFVSAMLVFMGAFSLWVPIYRSVRLSRAEKKKIEMENRVERSHKKVDYLPLSFRHRDSIRRPGLTFGYDVETGKELFVPNERLKRHTLVLGGTGTGKSSFLNALAFQQMLRGGGLIMVDAKRDTEAIRRFAWMTEVSGRMIDFRLIDLGDPRGLGHKYNPLAMQGSTEERAANLANRIFQAMPPVDTGSDAQHYRELIFDSLAEMVSIILATRKSFTVEDVQYLFKYPEESFEVIEADLKAVNDYDALRRLYRYRRSHWGDRNQKLAKWQADMSTLSGALGRLMTDEFKEAMSISASGEINLMESFLKKHILYFALPWMTKTESCQGLMRMLLSHLQQVIGELAERGGGPEDDIPFMIILDEFGSYAQPGFAEVIRMGRSAGAAIFLVVQTLSRLSDHAIGLNENFARDILNNCRSIAAFSVQDFDDAKKISARWGEKTRGMKTIAVSMSEGESDEKAGIKKVTNPKQTTTQGLSEGMREMKDFVVAPSMLMQHLRWVRDGKGRAIVECDPRGARVADTVWADVTPPDDFVVSRVLPKVSTSGAMQPLALVGRVDQNLSPAIQVEVPSTSNAGDDLESRKEKAAPKADKHASSQKRESGKEIYMDKKESNTKKKEIPGNTKWPGKKLPDDNLGALSYLAGLSG